ncbi:ammonium transporter AmtB-like domain-containing protein [Rhexocercosporidium sp. MPI-PUGE-AT-0058]|nr:ammonium transporter AmtB-like domain-containing protein [Rhexocercosporidium sp. MPI-PUGE-AT-0058]
MSQYYRFDVVTAFNAASLNISAEDFSNRNPNEFYSGGDLAWMMFSSGLVLLMVPGLGLFYSGISERCSAISMMWLSMMTTALIGIQWFLWGYTITFTGSRWLWGGADSVALHSAMTIPWGNKPGTKIPQISYTFYQGMFACFTAAVVSGAAIRKGRPLHFLVFIFIWSTLVYDPIARSSWNPVGWSNYWKGETSGVFDFAGGTVVHIVSATTSAVYSIFFKWRRTIFRLPPLQKVDEDSLNRPYKPHNVVNVVLGTAFLWIGWFGFNGGSALGANLRAASACISTHLAACAGAVMGSLLEYLAASRRDVDAGRFSVVGFCNGAVAGLVAITPAAGYVPYWSAPIFGIAGSFFVALFQDISVVYFDTNEIFVVHGVAGWVGMLLTAGFARADVAALDGYTVIINHKWEQLGIQVSDGLVGMAWSGGMTFLILLCMEAFIVFTRRFRGISEPEFQLILDQDIVLDHEIGDEFAVRAKDSNGLALVGLNSHREGRASMSGVGELEAGNFVPRVARRERSRSRPRRFV